MKVSVLSAVLVAFIAQAAYADSHSTDYFHYKDWAVRAVTWDDGTSSCVAENTMYPDSFSIWKYKDHSVHLQFYSPDWDFGTKDSYGTIGIQVDDQKGWSASNADFYKNSVLVDINDTKAVTEFLAQVSAGKTLYLLDDKGKEQDSYSLLGAREAIDVLDDCLATLH